MEERGQLEQLNLGLLLFIPYRALEDRVFAALAAAGFDDFTPAQARVFQRIGPDGTRLTELAQAAQITKQTAGFLVDQLERAGYVERTPDPTDARARLVRPAAPRPYPSEPQSSPRSRPSGPLTSATNGWPSSGKHSTNYAKSPTRTCES